MFEITRRKVLQKMDLVPVMIVGDEAGQLLELAPVGQTQRALFFYDARAIDPESFQHPEMAEFFEGIECWMIPVKLYGDQKIGDVVQMYAEEKEDGQNGGTDSKVNGIGTGRDTDPHT